MLIHDKEFKEQTEAVHADGKSSHFTPAFDRPGPGLGGVSRAAAAPECVLPVAEALCTGSAGVVSGGVPPGSSWTTPERTVP